MISLETKCGVSPGIDSLGKARSHGYLGGTAHGWTGGDTPPPMTSPICCPDADLMRYFLSDRPEPHPGRQCPVRPGCDMPTLGGPEVGLSGA
jgi:hypothetical protein